MKEDAWYTNLEDAFVRWLVEQGLDINTKDSSGKTPLFYQMQRGNLALFIELGAAKTVQGEVIRITGRVSHELYRNGGANWNADYRKMLNALTKQL